MNNKFFNAMSGVVKRFRLGQILTIVLAGVLVLVTTACNPNSPSVSGTGEYHERAGQATGIREYTDRADSKSRPDVNSYSDNDARDTASARARAKDLSDRAERNARKTQDVGDVVESYREGKPVQDRARDLAKDVGNAAENFKEDFAEGTRENLSNLRSNTDKANQNIQRTTKQAADDAADTVRGRA